MVRAVTRLRLKVTTHPHPLGKAQQGVAGLETDRLTGAAIISL
jgi:hypothetical protein